MRAALLPVILFAALAACENVSIDSTPPVKALDVGAGQGGQGCVAPAADCDHDGSCEASLDSTDDCGACGNVCSSNNANPSCADGKCVLACAPGFADCNGLASDGCESELSLDPNNCSACGQSCGKWGDCLQGSCLLILATAEAALVGADALVLEDDSVYWSTPGFDSVGEVASVPIAGGAVSPLVTGIKFPERLRSNGDWLVWSDVVAPGIYRMKLPSGPMETVLGSPSLLRVLDIDDMTVYFTAGTDIQMVPIAGGAPTTIATGFTDVRAARLANDTLYVVDGGPEVDQMQSGQTILGYPEGTITALSMLANETSLLAKNLDSPIAVAVTSDSIYWAEAGSMTTYAIGDASINLGTLGRIVRANLDGSSAIALASNLVQPVDLAADATHLYWANAGTVGGSDPMDTAYKCDGSLMRVALQGGLIEPVMPAIDARNVVLSDTAVFFSSWNLGVILEIKKP